MNTAALENNTPLLGYQKSCKRTSFRNIGIGLKLMTLKEGGQGK